MRTRIVRIGNSQGVRIPKPLLEEVGLPEEVEMTVVKNTIVIAPALHPRQGWAQAFREMAERGDDALIDAEAVEESDWDRDEWQWE